MMKLAKLIAAVAVALLGAAGLAACGSGTYVPTPDPVTPAPTVDAFFTAVSGIVASSPEDTEPVAIEAQTATTPEDSEPQPLG
jgi:hypothetical protein